MNRRHPVLVLILVGICCAAYGATVKYLFKDASTNIVLDLVNFANLQYNGSVVLSAVSSSVLTNKTFDADGSGNSISNIENADIKSGAAIDAAKLANGQVSSTEFQYLDGVTSAIQTQIQAKAESGVNSSITSLTGLTTALSIPQGGTGETSAALALTALGGQPTHALLSSLASCAPETNDMPYFATATTIGKKAIVTTVGANGYDTCIATEKAVRTALTAVALPAAGTQGRIVYDNGAAWVALATSDSGKYLKTQGVGANPMWDTPAGGGDMLAAVYAPAETGVVCNTGGSFTTETYLAVTRGGTGRSCAGETGFVYDTNGVFSVLSGLTAGTHYKRTGVVRNIWIDAGAMRSTTTAGAASGETELSVNKQNADLWDFDSATNENVQFRVCMPDEWDRGTVKVKFYWTASTGSGDTAWDIQAVATSNHDPIDASWGTAVEVVDTLTAVADVCATAATGAVTVGGTPALGDVVWWQVFRHADDAADTLTGDARLIGVMIQYTESATEPAAW